MSGNQLTFDLPVRPATGRAAFFVAPGNALALAELDRWQSWPVRKLALVGPEGAGKSHLAAVWATEAGARTMTVADLARAEDLPAGADLADAAQRLVVEDAEGVAGDPVAEEALLHLHNRTLDAGGTLVMTARIPPARWPVALPDLASRLAATPIARLEMPDDALLAALLRKLLDDRQLRVSAELIPYCVPRMERSFAAAQRLVTELDARALRQKRPVGRKLAAEVLDDDGETRHNPANPSRS
ncbi:MAG: DnaA/Hda family protein [Pseudomonadota bacterium]